MPEASAPGKVILFGEHAVVYGRPAIAAPVTQVRARAIIEPLAADDVALVAPDIGLRGWYAAAGDDDPLAAPLRQVQAVAGLSALRGFSLTVTSDIPIASGLGSGAAIAVAVIRVAAAHLGLAGRLTTEQISAMAFEVERLHHGTPSGIDNTVIAYEQPVYFVRAQPRNHIETFAAARPLRLLVGDTGIRSSTRDVVGDVRRQWEQDGPRFEPLFDACGTIAAAAREAIAAGDLPHLGALMNDNHHVLQEMTVSSPELDVLVEAARAAGATGAKMSGGGRGGNMIALVDEETEEAVRAGLMAAGAVRVLLSVVS